MQDPYQILGVSRTATDEEITSAYKKLARKYHPDLNPGDKAAEKKMQEINAAYDTVKDIRSGKRPDTSYYGSSDEGQNPYTNPYGSPFGNGYGNPFGNGYGPFGYGQANGTYGSDSQDGSEGGSYGPFVWRTWSPGSSGRTGSSRGGRSCFWRVLIIIVVIRLISALFSSLFGYRRSYYTVPNTGSGYYYTNPYSGYGYYTDPYGSRTNPNS